MPYAFAVKINDFGKYTGKPHVHSTYKDGSLKPIIDMDGPGLSAVYYTMDGSEPSISSLVYKKPFSVSKTTKVKAIAYQEGSLLSDIANLDVIKYEWINAIHVNPKQGINYKYYEPEENNIDINSSLESKLINSGIAKTFSLENKQRKEKFAFDFSGYIKISKDGQYTFYTSSDDGSKLFIDDTEIVNNDGNHGEVEKSGIAFLKKGFHKIEVRYFDSNGGNALKVLMKQQGKDKEEIPANILFH